MFSTLPPLDESMSLSPSFLSPAKVVHDNFEYMSYCRQWDQWIKNKPDTPQIFGLCWHNDSNNDPTTRWLLLACTGHGEVCVWKVPDPDALVVQDQETLWSFHVYNNNNYYYNNTFNTMVVNKEQQEQEQKRQLQLASFRKPIRRWKVSKGKLYSIQIIRDKKWLMVSGDEGVLLLDWKFLPSESSSLSRNDKEDDEHTLPLKLKVIARYQPFPCPLEQQLLGSRIEVNQACLDMDQQFLFGAAGDAFGCYKWNVETQQFLWNYQLPNNNNNKGSSSSGLLTLQLFPSKQQQQQQQQGHLQTGGENGVVAIWDVKQDALVEQMNIHDVVFQHGSKQEASSALSLKLSSKTAGIKRKASAAATSHLSGSCCITSLVHGGEGSSWWTVGGAMDSVNGGGGGGGGFLATYHEPTRSFVASTTTPYAIHQLASPSAGGLDRNRFWAVGQGRTCVQYNPFTLHDDDDGNDDGDGDEFQKTTWCSPRECYAVAVAPHQDKDEDNENENDSSMLSPLRVAVAGIGHSIDLLQDDQVVFRFQLE